MSLTVRELREVVLTALATAPNLQVFDGEPDSGIPFRGYKANGKATAVIVDPDGRAHIHAALYLGVGRPDDERACGDNGATNLTFQVTCIGGDQERALVAIDRVKGALHGLRVDEDQARILLDDVDQGPLRVDRDPPPSRTYLPLYFRVLL